MAHERCEPGKTKNKSFIANQRRERVGLMCGIKARRDKNDVIM